MAGLKEVFLGAVAASMVLASSHVHAQQDRQSLSAQEVKRYLESAEQDAIQAVQAGEYERLMDWIKQNIADEATFSLSVQVYVGDERKGFAVTSLDAPDMLRLGRFAVGMMPDQVQDYSLDIEVTNVDPIGPNAAMATTQITESGKFAAGSGSSPGGQASGAAGAQQSSSGPIQIEATSQCTFLIRRGEDDEQLAIGMANCQSDVRL